MVDEIENAGTENVVASCFWYSGYHLQSSLIMLRVIYFCYYRGGFVRGSGSTEGEEAS